MDYNKTKNSRNIKTSWLIGKSAIPGSGNQSSNPGHGDKNCIIFLLSSGQNHFEAFSPKKHSYGEAHF